MLRTIAYCGCGNISVDGLNFGRVEDAATPTLQCAACGAVSSDFTYIPASALQEVVEELERGVAFTQKLRDEECPREDRQGYRLEGKVAAYEYGADLLRNLLDQSPQATQKGAE